MANHWKDFTKQTDEQILDELCAATNVTADRTTQLLDYIQFKTAMAQQRAAIATEKYTRITFWLLIVTAVGVLLSLASAGWKLHA